MYVHVHLCRFFVIYIYIYKYLNKQESIIIKYYQFHFVQLCYLFGLGRTASCYIEGFDICTNCYYVILYITSLDRIGTLQLNYDTNFNFTKKDAHASIQSFFYDM